MGGSPSGILVKLCAQKEKNKNEPVPMKWHEVCELLSRQLKVSFDYLNFNYIRKVIPYFTRMQPTVPQQDKFLLNFDNQGI